MIVCIFSLLLFIIGDFVLFFIINMLSLRVD